MKLLSALVAPVAAVLLAVGCASAAAPASSPATALSPVGGPTAAAPASSPATAYLSRAVAALRIPWSRISPGWELVQIGTGSVYQPGPVTLDLVDPSGHRYRLYHWAAPASKT